MAKYTSSVCTSYLYFVFLVLLGGIIICATANDDKKDSKKDVCPPGEVCWILQGTEESRKNLKKVGDSCRIAKITRPVSDVSGKGRSTLNVTEWNCTVEDCPNGNNTDEHYPDMIIDECADEENRNFMECVLDFDPSIKENSADFGKGVCLCYRDWSVNSNRSPAYNHSLNYTQESHEWFYFSKKYNECVIRRGKRCAPGGTLVVPYRCEDIEDVEHNTTVDSRCIDSDVDPHFMVCRGNLIFNKSALIIVIFLYFI